MHESKSCLYMDCVIHFIPYILVLVLAFLQYFTLLEYPTSFVDDEFPSAETALEFSKTGDLSYVRLDGTTREYRRAWPATVMLGIWIRFFGMSELSCRSLSGVYGILFIASMLYISYRLFGTTIISVVVGLMSVAEPVLTYYFRFTRMYSLEVLLSLWTYYLVYRTCHIETQVNEEASNKHAYERIKRLILFFISLSLIYASFVVHTNTIISLIGCYSYVIYSYLRTKDRILGGIVIVGLIGILLVCFNFLYYHFSGSFLALTSDFDYLRRSITNSFVQSNYLKYIFGTSGALYLSVVLFSIIVVKAIKEKSISDAIVYILCIVSTTLIFFCLFSGGIKHYASKYILHIVPGCILVWAYGIVCFKNLIARVKYCAYFYGFLVLVIIVFEINLIASSISSRKAEAESHDVNYNEAYNTISEYYDLNSDTVPIVECLLRKYYFDEVISNYVIADLNRKNDMDIWLEFVNRYPQGIITVEELKMKGLKQDVGSVILNWTDRLSGQGVDNYGVNVSYYNFVKPDSIIYKSDLADNEIVSARINHNEIIVTLVMKKLEIENPKVVFAHLYFELLDGTVRSQYFGFLTNQTDVYCYRLSDTQLHDFKSDSVVAVSVEDSIAVWDDELFELNNR